MILENPIIRALDLDLNQMWNFDLFCCLWWRLVLQSKAKCVLEVEETNVGARVRSEGG